MVAERQSDILATGGVHIGGTDFDKQLSLQGVMPLFGYGSRMKSGALMPTSYHLNLATWHTINALYSQKSQLALGSMRYDIEDSFGIDRLFKLIEQRAGHWLAMEVEASKIELTEHDSRRIDLRRVEPELTAELTRALFEEAIDGLLERVRGSVTELLAKAGVSEGQVDTVFFTGVPAEFRRCATACRRCCRMRGMWKATSLAALVAAWPSRPASVTAQPEPSWGCFAAPARCQTSSARFSSLFR